MSGDFQQNANKVGFILKSVYIETLQCLETLSGRILLAKSTECTFLYIPDKFHGV